METLVREAFWDRTQPGCVEHYLLHRFREDRDFVPELDLVLERDGEIVGQVMAAWSTVWTETDYLEPVLTLGPLCIAPAWQGRGLGTLLLSGALARAKELDAAGVFVQGEPGFFGRLGFRPAKAWQLTYCRDVPPDHLLVKELRQDWLEDVQGSYQEPAGYFVAASEVAAFDASFPYKEKRWTPREKDGPNV